MASAQKLYSYVLSVSLLLVITACGGGGGSSENTALSIASITPGNNSERVAIDATIQVQFSEAIDPASFNQTTAPLSNSAGTVAATYSVTGSLGTIIPDTPLSHITQYRLENTSDIKSLAGNSLSLPEVSVFATVLDSTAWYRLTNARRGPEMGLAAFDNGSANPRCRMKFGGDLWQFVDNGQRIGLYVVSNIDFADRSIEGATPNDGKPCQLNLNDTPSLSSLWSVTSLGSDLFQLETGEFALEDGYLRTTSNDDAQHWLLTPAEQGDIRLVDGPNGGVYEGRLEFLNQGVSGKVCDDVFENDNKGATVACRQLGMSINGSSERDPVVFAADTKPFWLDDVLCEGTEARLEDCSSDEIGSHNCEHSEDVGIDCIALAGDLRLAEGANAAEGRLEISNGSEWQTVCDDIFADDNDGAIVACRQLGFNTGTVADQRAFVAGTGTIGLYNVDCLGTEARLEDCASNGGGNSCSHADDVGIFCQ